MYDIVLLLCALYTPGNVLLSLVICCIVELVEINIHYDEY